MNKVAKVPVVMQMEALECGAASLCMILAYYGLWIPLENVIAGEEVEFSGYHSCSWYDNKAGCESEQHCKWETHLFKEDSCVDNPA